MLSGLSPNTLYYYQIRSRDVALNLGTATGQFSTQTDTVALVISAVAATNVASTTATITWATNEPATSKVYYALSFPVNTASSPFVSMPALILSHSIALTSLNASTTYYYSVESQDASGNTAWVLPSKFLL